jgi:hypothetical protein
MACQRRLISRLSFWPRPELRVFHGGVEGARSALAARSAALRRSRERTPVSWLVDELENLTLLIGFRHVENKRNVGDLGVF